MNMREKIISSLSKTKPISYEKLFEQFNENEQFLAEVLLGDLVEQGIVELTIKGTKKSFLLTAEIEKAKPIKAKPSDQKKSNFELTATLPESILSTGPGIETTRTSIRELLSTKTNEILVSQPFIDNIFIDVYEDEIRKHAKKGTRFILLTRKVETDSWSIKGILRIFDMYSMYGHIDKFEVYEHWVPLRTGKNNSKQYIGLHAKLVMVDNAGYMGSANWTGYALSNNFELGMIIKDSQTLSKLRRLFFQIAAKSSHIDVKKIHQHVTCKSGGRYGRGKSNKHRF